MKKTKVVAPALLILLVVALSDIKAAAEPNAPFAQIYQQEYAKTLQEIKEFDSQKIEEVNNWDKALIPCLLMSIALVGYGLWNKQNITVMVLSTLAGFCVLLQPIVKIEYYVMSLYAKAALYTDRNLFLQGHSDDLKRYLTQKNFHEDIKKLLPSNAFLVMVSMRQKEISAACCCAFNNNYVELPNYFDDFLAQPVPRLQKTEIEVNQESNKLVSDTQKTIAEINEYNSDYLTLIAGAAGGLAGIGVGVKKKDDLLVVGGALLGLISVVSGFLECRKVAHLSTELYAQAAIESDAQRYQKNDPGLEQSVAQPFSKNQINIPNKPIVADYFPINTKEIAQRRQEAFAANYKMVGGFDCTIPVDVTR